MEKIQRALEKAREARQTALRTRQAEDYAASNDEPRREHNGADSAGWGRGIGATAFAPGRRRDRSAGMAKVQEALSRTARPAGQGAESEAAVDDPLAAGPEREAGGSGVADVSTVDRQIRRVEVSPAVLERNRVLATDVEGAAADAFRILRTQLLARLKVRKGRVIAVCAPGQGNGKTLVAVNSAVAAVRQLNQRAVLVDLDLRRPSVHRHFGLERGHGVSDYLLGQQPLEACLLGLGSDRLIVLPQFTSIPASSELLSSPRMGALVRELKARYADAVLIYDCPPLLTTDDPLLALRHADGCLLVVREGKTRKAELLRAAELVGQDRLLGTVLNNARWSSASSYYYG